MTEYLNLSLNSIATTQPVQAPVAGNGIATKIASPIASYLSTILALFFVLSKNQSKNFFKGPHLLKNSLIGLKKRSSGITGMELPTIAKKKLLSAEKS